MSQATALKTGQIRHLLRVTAATSRHPERDKLALLLGLTCGKANAVFVASACNGHDAFVALANRVANLNAGAGEIGEGMLASLVDDVKRALTLATTEVTEPA